MPGIARTQRSYAQVTIARGKFVPYSAPATLRQHLVEFCEISVSSKLQFWRPRSCAEKARRSRGKRGMYGAAGRCQICTQIGVPFFWRPNSEFGPVRNSRNVPVRRLKARLPHISEPQMESGPFCSPVRGKHLGGCESTAATKGGEEGRARARFVGLGWRVGLVALPFQSN